MTCPECGGEMHPDDVQGWVFAKRLIVNVLVCKDDACRFVVIVDWRWKPAAQHGKQRSPDGTGQAVHRVASCAAGG